MPPKRFRDEQIVAILREADAGKPVPEICRQHSITRTTFYRWKRIFGGLDVSQARQFRAVQEENSKLKKKLAELLMEVEDLRHLLSKKW